MSKKVFAMAAGVPFRNKFSASFDGVDEFINNGDIANFERTDPFSVVAWVKTTVIGSAQTVLSRNLQSVSQRGWLVFMAVSNKISLFMANNTGAQINVDGSTSINDGNHHLIAITYSGNSLASGVNLYVDGAIETPNVLADTLGTNTILNGANCQTGARDGTSLPWDGNIDEPTIYDKELSAAEVTEIYNAGKPRDLKKLLSSSGNLFGWWRFTQIDIDNFTTIADHSGNSRDGIAVNMGVGNIVADTP